MIGRKITAKGGEKGMKHYKKETYKTKDEWLNARGLGGSSASAIMGCNKWMSKIDLYKAIMFPNMKKVVSENESMAYGVKCEPMIRKQFALDFEKKYDVHEPESYEMYRSTRNDYMTATLDGILTDKDTKEKLVLEIKTHDVQNYKDLQEWENHLPQNYFIQVCHYLLVMDDFKGAILCAKLRFFGKDHQVERQEIRYYKIDRVEIEDSLKNLEKAEIDFWNNHILKREMPNIEITF